MPSTPRATFGLLASANYPASTDLRKRLSDLREEVALAREVGFTSVVANQHFLSHPTTSFSTIPYLSSLIDISGDMRLVIGVALMPLQNPVYLAEDVATLDWLSGGRVILGLAMGYRPEEFKAMGVSLRERRGRFEEGIEVMKRIWAAEDSWSFEGRYFQYDDLPGGLKPVQKPHPPMWFAADVDVAVERAGRLNAAWYSNPRAGLTSLKRQADIYSASLQAHGNSVPDIFPLRRELFIAPTDEEARRIAVPHIVHQLELYHRWGQFEAMPEADRPPMTFDEEHIPDAFLVGSPATLAEQILRYVDTLGVNHFVCKITWPGMEHRDVMRSIELMGQDLTPLLV